MLIVPLALIFSDSLQMTFSTRHVRKNEQPKNISSKQSKMSSVVKMPSEKQVRCSHLCRHSWWVSSIFIHIHIRNIIPHSRKKSFTQSQLDQIRDGIPVHARSNVSQCVTHITLIESTDKITCRTGVENESNPSSIADLLQRLLHQLSKTQPRCAYPKHFQ